MLEWLKNILGDNYSEDIAFFITFRGVFTRHREKQKVKTGVSFLPHQPTALTASPQGEGLLRMDNGLHSQKMTQ
ncbi:MAG: hypothetical protein K6F76_01720 [Clostridiales bacterium]|nr:hypothetical protein [Clostridiales bacterium]